MTFIFNHRCTRTDSVPEGLELLEFYISRQGFNMKMRKKRRQNHSSLELTSSWYSTNEQRGKKQQWNREQRSFLCNRCWPACLFLVFISLLHIFNIKQSFLYLTFNYMDCEKFMKLGEQLYCQSIRVKRKFSSNYWTSKEQFIIHQS